MKRLLYLITYIGCVSVAHAQYKFQAVSLSEALILLDQSSKRYDISFVYDELEDFTVTKTVRKNISLPDAVREVCGFYPVRVTTKGHDILVECIQKDRTKLSGRLVDGDRQPVAYANIVLYDDTLVIGGGVSNEAGDFVIPCHLSQVKVRISCVGFKTIERQMPVADVGTIRMQMDNLFLQNVTVNGNRPIIRNEANRLQYIVNNDEYAQGLNALELLSRVPMVSMVNGRATILGKGPARYMMNGRVMEMDDEVIHQRLWSMHAEDIERIEVISMPTGKYLTDLGGGYINIMMNRDQSLGWRSDLSVQAGTSDKWSGRTDASVNYASEKLDMALDVNGNWLTKTEDKDMYYHTFDRSTTTTERNVISRKETEDKDFGANLMLRYLPRKNLEAGAFASYQQLWPKSDIVSEAISNHIIEYSDLSDNKKILYSDLSSESELKYADNHVLNLSAYIDWILGKPDSRLSLSYNFYQKQDDNESNVFSKNVKDYHRSLFYTEKFTNESTYRIQSARIDFSTPLSTATTVNAGFSYTTIRNMANTELSGGDAYINQDVLQINYHHQENLLAGYLSVQHNFNRKLKAIVALRYEYAKTSQQYEQGSPIDFGDIKNDHFFPTLSLNYSPTDGEQIGVAWAMSVTRPNFYDLNPLWVFETLDDISYGNPFLTPSYENRVEVNYTGREGLYADFYYTHGKDQTDWITTVTASSSSTVPFNTYNSDKTGLYANYHHHFSRWLNIIAEGDVFYYDAEIYSPGNNSANIFFHRVYPLSSKLHGWGKRLAISSDVFLNHQHSLMLNARYDQWLDNYVGLSKTGAYGYFTFALRYSLLNDRLKLSLTAIDPFHQQVKDKTMYYYLNNSQKIHTNLHSHYIGLTASYSLGGKKVRQIHHNYNNTEQQRAEKK